MQNPTFRLEMPRTRDTSVIFASPHSGRDYRSEFLRRSILDERTIRSSEDAFVDRLFDSAPSCGAPLLAATAPRAYVDLNRAATELDPAVIRGVRPQGHNPRVSSGLGVIPRVVAGGQAIYRGKLDLEEAERRLELVWYPYHHALQTLLDGAHALFGNAILIDCHSMPHEAVRASATKSSRRPQVVLGDRFGAAAAPEIVDRVEAAFESADLTVARNTPFAGAFVTQHYGRPSRGQHVIQIEIDRGLYMDERHVVPGPHFAGFRDALRAVIGEISEIGRAQARPLAAE